jgi:hypothetical protein
MARTRASTVPQAGGSPCVRGFGTCLMPLGNERRGGEHVAASAHDYGAAHDRAGAARGLAGANASTRAGANAWNAAPAAPRLDSLSAVCSGGNRRTENLSSGSVDHPYAVRTAEVRSWIVAGVSRRPRR